jgi:LPXTG-motif cell wall-anchored protein
VQGGVQTLPSTSTAPAPFGLLGLAFIALGGLFVRRRGSPKI